MSETIIEYKEESQALELIERVKTVCITSTEKYDEAGRLKVALKGEREKKFQLWEDLRKPAYDSYQNILKNMKAELDPFDSAIKKVQAIMDDWVTEQAIKARKEQERLEQETREKARIEQERILAQAVEAENKRKALLAEAEKAQSEKEKAILLSKAEKVEAKQEALEEKAEQVFPEPVFTKYEPPKGTKRDVVLTITDVKAICEWIGAGRIPTSVVEIKEGQLKKWVMMHDKKGKEVPGVIIKESVKTTVRR